MAVTISRYNHTAKLVMNKELNYATLKVMLLNASASFTASNTTLAQVTNSGAYQVSGNGWTAGGLTIANAAVTVVATSGAMIDGDDVSATATGGNIGPAFAAVIYDDSHGSDAPLWFIDFDGSQEAGDGTDFKVAFHSSGIARVTSA